MTLGQAARAGVRLIVWCRDCHHEVEIDPAEMAQRYDMTVPDTGRRFVCGQCGSKNVDFVVSGTRHDPLA